MKEKEAIKILIDRRIAMKKECNNCKHYPPSKKWPCNDCNMMYNDRWEPKTDGMNQIFKFFRDASHEEMKEVFGTADIEEVIKLDTLEIILKVSEYIKE